MRIGVRERCLWRGSQLPKLILHAGAPILQGERKAQAARRSRGKHAVGIPLVWYARCFRCDSCYNKQLLLLGYASRQAVAATSRCASTTMMRAVGVAMALRIIRLRQRQGCYCCSALVRGQAA